MELKIFNKSLIFQTCQGSPPERKIHLTEKQKVLYKKII
jgi:hypothetical protein